MGGTVKATTIYLVRHGEVHNPEQILYGRLPGYRLSENGQQQARAAADALRRQPLAALFASPQQRAQETAGYLAAAHPHLKVETETLLDEVNTPWQGRPLAELDARAWDIYTGNQPPHELPEDILARARGFFAKVRALYPGQAVAAVTHGDLVVLSFLFAMRQPAEVILRRDLLALGLPERYPATASINRLTFTCDDVDEIPAYEYLRPY